jgi:5-methylcytosine-specific restriction protein A
MARVEFTRKVRTAVIARANGKCEKCRAAVKPGAFEIDHILEAAYGGEATLANAQLLCLPCHKEKTAHGTRGMRKAERARDKASGAIKPRSKLSRPKADKPAGKPSLKPRMLFRAALEDK